MFDWFFGWWSGSNEEKINREKILEEQFAEYRANKEPLKQPWREYPEDIFLQDKSEKLRTKDRLLEKILGDSPPEPCNAINLMVMGNIGSGKSSFINTLFTVFRNNGQISTIASPHGINTPSTTKRFHEVTLMTFRNGKKLRIYDCRGVHDAAWASEIYKKDLIQAIDGCIKKDYEFKKKDGISEESVFFRPNPTISDKMHCVLYVTEPKHLQPDDLKILGPVREYVDNKDIPLRLILTKMDQQTLCGFDGDLKGIFRSRQAKQKVELAIKNFGVQDCQVLPIANYVKGMEQNTTQDVLALLTIDNILQEAITYIKNENKS